MKYCFKIDTELKFEKFVLKQTGRKGTLEKSPFIFLKLTNNSTKLSPKLQIRVFFKVMKVIIFKSLFLILFT